MSIATTPLPLLAFKSDEVSRGFGRLEVQQQDQRVQLPLAAVDIRARVVDRFAESTLVETFRNPFTEHLEATYVFPLPGGAAVSDFEMHVAGRVIRGAVEERAEARRQYSQALQEGKRAALLEKERDDVFTVAVGNLPPGEEVKVVIRWSERLPYFDDGTTELRLPLVVAPRYIPGAGLDRDSVGKGTEHDTDVVPDASRITPPRLAEGFDPKTSLTIEVDLRDEALEDLGCSQHATRLKLERGGVTVKLAREGERLDRDFVLRWRVASDKIETRVWQSGAHAALSIVPPKREGFLGVPRDVVFVLDRSGSMSGTKMVSASRACAILLATLGPRDRFAIQLFDDVVEWYDPNSGQVGGACGPHTFIAADEAGIEKGEKFLRTVEARGGTELDLALRQALDAMKKAGEGARAQAVVLLTDGQVGDESRVLKRLQTELGDSRVFTVGIDTAVNETFLRRMATAAGGTATFVTPGDSLEEALRSVGREIGTPLVVDVEVHGVADLAPAVIPDLFAGRATVAYFCPAEAREVRVTGRFADGQPFEQRVPFTPVEMPAIAQLWARTRITDLEDRFRIEPGQQEAIKAEIIAISKAHRVLTRFTAFVVVDDEVVNKDGKVRAVTQPVEMPAEWEDPRMDKLMSMPMSAPVMRSMPLMSMGPIDAEACDELAPPAAWSAAPGAAPPAPPPPPPAARGIVTGLGASAPPPAKKQRASVEKKGGFLGGLFRKREQAEVTAYQRQSAEGGGGDPGADVHATDIHAALAALVKLVEKALEDLRAGRRPDAGALNKARQALLDALASSSRGPDLVLAQRFVRTAALEMVAALGSEADAAALLPLFERHAAALEQAREEAVTVLGRPQAGFWESTI